MAIGPLQIDAGVSVGAGITFFGGPYGVVTYDEMPPPVLAGFAVEDQTATINGSVGFTINNPDPGTNGGTGIAVFGLTGDNLTFCSNLTVNEYYTVRFGTGSTHFTVDCQVTTVPVIGDPASFLTFYLDPAVSFPATCNYPFYII
jgi:hypothetical protein